MPSCIISEENSRGLPVNLALFPSSHACILSTQADQTFIATEDTGQQLCCLLSLRTAQGEFYICPNWKKLKSFTSNYFATERRAFSCSELFMKWFCFPENISIFHWKPEQANQETAWNTSILKSHHSTPEMPVCFFVGEFVSPPNFISQIHQSGSSADAYIPSYMRKEYC